MFFAIRNARVSYAFPEWNLLCAQAAALAMTGHKLGATGHAHGTDSFGWREIQTTECRGNRFHIE